MPTIRHLCGTKMSNDPTQLPHPRVEAFYFMYYVMGLRHEWGLRRTYYIKSQTRACFRILRVPTIRHLCGTKMSKGPNATPTPTGSGILLYVLCNGPATRVGVTGDLLHKITNACLLSNPTRAHYSASLRNEDVQRTQRNSHTHG